MITIERKAGKEILALDGNENVYENNVLHNWLQQISEIIEINTKTEGLSNKPCLCCA